jgi:FAD/FMN-containing dehydrogenase
VEKQAAGFGNASSPVVTAQGYIDLAKTSVGVSTPHFSFETSFDKDLAAFEVGRIIGGEYVDLQAGLSVEPASLAEAREVFSLANSHRWPLIPAGAGTWLGAGYTDVSRCIAVKTSRMTRITEYEPSDLVATAEAGISLSSFNRYLINCGRQWLALDPPNDGSVTIGGLAATGLGGAQAFGYGAPRNSIIGMHVLLADGRVIKSGGRVVKNVAGYDLCKLFTGSYGTLGLILDVTFKLRPVPARQCTVVAQGKSAALLNIGRQIIQSNIGPVALELLSQGIARFVDKSFTGSDTVLMIRFAGNDKSVQFQIARTLELIGAEDRGVQTSLNDEDEQLWDSLAVIPLRFADMTVSRTKLTSSGLPSLISNCPLPRMWHGGLGDGRIRMIEDDDEDAERRIRMMKKSVEANGGRWVLETARPEIKEAVGVWGEFAGEKIMRRIKTELDPMGGMSPNRFWA